MEEPNTMQTTWQEAQQMFAGPDLKALPGRSREHLSGVTLMVEDTTSYLWSRLFLG